MVLMDNEQADHLAKKKRLQNQAEDDKRNIFRKKATETKKDPPQKKGTDFKRPPK